MAGIYAGISQSNILAGGRIFMSLIEDEEFECTEPRLFDLVKGEHLDLFQEKPFLRRFFSGMSNDHLDDARIFEPSSNFPTRDYMIPSKYVGSYFMYRTRTSPVKNMHTKRLMIYIGKDGATFMKFNPFEKNYDENTINGQTFYFDSRLYIQFYHENSHEGLAVFHLSDDNSENYHAGMFVDTEKHTKVIAGHVYLYKLTDDKTAFMENSAVYISPKSEDYNNCKEEEKKIVDSLIGQTENYLIRHNASYLSEDNHGKFYFDLSCFYAFQENSQDSIKLLEKALWEGGFRDFVLFEKQMSEGGYLYEIRSEIIAWANAPLGQYAPDFIKRQKSILEKWINQLERSSSAY